MKKDRFDLEQVINECWNVVDDIEDYVKRNFDSPRGALTEDEQMNILLGISSVYRMKFEKLIDTFEEVFSLKMEQELFDHIKDVINRKVD